MDQYGIVEGQVILFSNPDVNTLGMFTSEFGFSGFDTAQVSYEVELSILFSESKNWYLSVNVLRHVHSPQSA